MKLGEKLKKTIEELELAKINGIDAQNKADMNKIRRERQETKNWLYGIRDSFVDQIDIGRVPMEKVNDYDKQKWLESAQKGKAANQDLWNEISQFWKSEGLYMVVNEQHDGVGIKSWKTISLKILPDRPRSRSANIDRCRFCGENAAGGECDGGCITKTVEKGRCFECGEYDCDHEGVGHYRG